MIYLRPLDLSVDEMMQEILDAVKRTGAKRLVIDSLAGFEMALAPAFRADFRESLYRMDFRPHCHRYYHPQHPGDARDVH